MKITSITQQKKNTSRYNIFVDGKYSFSLTDVQLLDLGIKKNQELTSSDLQLYEKASSDGKIRQRALEWTLNRPRSTSELRLYLIKKAIDPDQKDQIINDFRAKKYIDDERFAQWWADLRLAKNHSIRAIQYELKTKGIDTETISGIESLNEHSGADSLRAVIAKKSSNNRYRDDKQKLTRYLIGKGFQYGDIKKALESEDFGELLD
jgi:regulatory protein